jgi:hypothetical protein
MPAAHLRRIWFKAAQPVGPPLDGPWPGSRRDPLYWVARGIVDLPAPPRRASLLVAVDRHYELFLNGRRVLRQRNFISGDEYLIAQRWTRGLARHFRPGANTIEVLVRSDPWRNKNYRCFRPVLALEGRIAVEGRAAVPLTTGPAWQVAVVPGWRRFLAIATATHYEAVRIPPADATALGTVPGPLSFEPAVVADAPLPPVYLWTDPPKRTIVSRPVELVGSGTCELVPAALVFPIAERLADRPGPFATLEARFDDAGGRPFALAASAFVHSRIEFNGRVLAEPDNTPGPGQMGLYDHAAPAAEATTRPGENTMRVSVFRHTQGWMGFKLLVRGLPALLDPAAWRDGEGHPLSPLVLENDLGGQVNAKLFCRPSDELAFDATTAAVSYRPTGRRIGYATVRFDALTTARVSFNIEAATAGRALVAYGFQCDGSVIDCHRQGRNAVDALEFPAGRSRYEAFDVRTFRYLDFLFEGFSGPVTLSAIAAEENVFLDGKEVAFASSDERVDAIWRAGRRTAQLCANELYMDNPEREHTQWVDNVAANTAAGYYGFGEARKAGKALDEIALHQKPDGQIPGYAPGAWFPRIPLQCHMALFVISAHRHFMHTGDAGLARRLLAAILRMVAHWERHRTRQGLIVDLHTLFVDWGSHIYSYAFSWSQDPMPPTGALTTMNAYYLLALTRAADMTAFLGRPRDQQRLTDLAGEVRAAMRAHLFDAGLGMFRDGAWNAQAEQNVSQTANALAVWAGAAPDGLGAQVLARAFAPHPAVTIRANAHFAVQTGEALFSAGCDELGLRWLRDGFGPMVAAGSETLWETWEPHASHCQGTGSGVVYLFGRYLAGLYPVEPGYAAIGIDPHPASLGRLEARLATPHGLVGVAWRREDGRLHCQMNLPEGWRDRPIRPGADIDLEVTDEPGG